MRKMGVAVDPPAHSGEYLMSALFEVGPISSNGMGPTPVEWSALGPFGVVAGLNYQELVAIRRMSVAYLKGLEAGRSKDGAVDPPTEWPEEEIP